MNFDGLGLRQCSTRQKTYFRANNKFLKTHTKNGTASIRKDHRTGLDEVVGLPLEQADHPGPEPDHRARDLAATAEKPNLLHSAIYKPKRDTASTFFVKQRFRKLSYFFFFSWHHCFSFQKCDLKCINLIIITNWQIVFLANVILQGLFFRATGDQGRRFRFGRLPPREEPRGSAIAARRWNKIRASSGREEGNS